MKIFFLKDNSSLSMRININVIEKIMPSDLIQISMFIISNNTKTFTSFLPIFDSFKYLDEIIKSEKIKTSCRPEKIL
tara:strand:+ start:346 stop:576 length:231 start_codon:yes stop_codon:yes gene_type:complete